MILQNKMAFRTIFSALILSGCSEGGALADQASARGGEEVIYERVGTSNVEVYNETRSSFSVEGKEYLSRRDGVYSEFSGRSENCSDADYLCHKGGVNIVVPRLDTKANSWNFADISCNLMSGSISSSVSSISCDYKDNKVTFLYSKKNGVLEYVRSVDAEAKYKIIGDLGLFGER